MSLAWHEFQNYSYAASDRSKRHNGASQYGPLVIISPSAASVVISVSYSFCIPCSVWFGTQL